MLPEHQNHMPNTDFVNKDLKDDYTRWLSIVSPDDEQLSRCKIKAIDVLRAHYSIVDFFLEKDFQDQAIGGIGPRDKGLLISAVARQETSFGGRSKWKDDFEKCATLTYGIVKNHSFHDCNKRTALLVCLLYIETLLNRTPSEDQKCFEKLMEAIAENSVLEYCRKGKKDHSYEDSSVYAIAEFIRKKTRQHDRRFYEVTYFELNNILQRFGFHLENPQKNYIDIVRYEERKKYLVFGREKIARRVGTVGFPGWTRKIYQQNLRRVREICKLTPRYGYDSAVFFHGVDPLKSLVHDYEGALRRLAYK